MAKVRVNWNIIIVLILALIAVGLTGYSLRKYHRQQRAEVGLSDGLAAYEAGEWKKAAVGLGRYLAIHRNDVDILIKYAQSQLRIQPLKRQNLGQAINAYRAVLRLEENEQAAREIISLYLQFGMPAEAELIARRFADSTKAIAFRQALAESLVRQRKYDQALPVLLEMVHEQPQQMDAFKLLAEIAE